MRDPNDNDPGPESPDCTTETEDIPEPSCTDLDDE